MNSSSRSCDSRALDRYASAPVSPPRVSAYACPAGDHGAFVARVFLQKHFPVSIHVSFILTSRRGERTHRHAYVTLLALRRCVVHESTATGDRWRCHRARRHCCVSERVDGSRSWWRNIQSSCRAWQHLLQKIGLLKAYEVYMS